MKRSGAKPLLFIPEAALHAAEIKIL